MASRRRRLIVLGVVLIVSTSTVPTGIVTDISGARDGLRSDGGSDNSTLTDSDPTQDGGEHGRTHRPVGSSAIDGPAARSAAAASIRFGNATVRPHRNVTVRLWANGSTVAGYQANLTFDPTVVEIVNVTGADLSDPTTNVNETEGWAFIVQSQATGVDDPVLATITFRPAVNTSASAPIEFVRNDTILSDEQGDTIPIDRYGTGSVDVRSPVNLAGYDVSATEVTVNEPVTVNATLRNDAEANGSIDVTLYTDGDPAETRNVTVPANTTVNETLTATFGTAGSHTVRVNGLAPTTLAVQRREVALNLSANTTSPAPNGTVRFTVTRGDSGERTDATVTVNGTGYGTGPDGAVDVTFPSRGDRTAVASKENTSAATFANASLRIHVSPLTAVCRGCEAPKDPDDDGRYEDVNGNGRSDFADVVVLFDHLDDSAVADHPTAYDFNTNGRLDYDDIVTLFEKL